MIKKIIEGILFLSAKEWKIDDFSKLLKTDNETIEKALKQLEKEYNEKDLIMEIRKVGPYYSMNIKTKNISLLKKYIHIRELTRSEAKILAIIDAKKGIKKSLLSKKLGPKVYPDIAELVKRGFVMEVKEGRTSKLFTTQKYIDYKTHYK